MRSEGGRGVGSEGGGGGRKEYGIYFVFHSGALQVVHVTVAVE